MKKYTFILFLGIALWLGETWYFGWNEKAITVQEKMMDGVSWILILWGFIGDISSNLTIKKDMIVNTSKGVEIINKL